MLLPVACQTFEGSSDCTGNFLLGAVSELLRTTSLHSAETGRSRKTQSDTYNVHDSIFQVIFAGQNYNICCLPQLSLHICAHLQVWIQAEDIPFYVCTPAATKGDPCNTIFWITGGLEKFLAKENSHKILKFSHFY